MLRKDTTVQRHTLRSEQFLATATPLNLMQKTFLSNLRISFHFQVLTFCFDTFLMQKSDLIRKIRLISKFMM